jgi:hypothetical protein
VIRWTNQRDRATGRASEAPVMKVFQGLHNRQRPETALHLRDQGLTWEADDEASAEGVHGSLLAQANTIEGGPSHVLRNLIGGHPTERDAQRTRQPVHRRPPGGRRLRLEVGGRPQHRGADGPFGPEGLASFLGYTTIKVTEEVERAHQ